MAVKLRLARGGTKKHPFYQIVASDARSPRDGNFLEKIGTYNPMLPREHEQRVVLNTERAAYWLKAGAQPTDRVVTFLANAGLVEKPAPRNNAQKALPGKKAQERAQQRAAKAAKRAEAAAGGSDAAAEG